MNRSVPARFLLSAALLRGVIGCATTAPKPTCPDSRDSQATEPRPTASGSTIESESGFLSNIRQLTFESQGFFNAGEAYFSPDERSIIFQATPIGQEVYQIYTMELDGGRTRMVSTGRGACTCAFFHPDGRRIIYASSHLDPTLGQEETRADDEAESEYKWAFDEHMDIFEADPDGSNLKRLTDVPGYDAEGSYSPDGSRIVFTSQRDGDLEVYVMDADGANPRRITKAKGYDGGPFFSPDGRTILYRGDRRNDGEMNLQLRIVNADGTDDRAITDNAVFNWCPYWYPDGRSFIYTRADHRGRPNYDLYMMKVDGGDPIRITFNAAFDGLPVFNHDGTKLMWTSQRGGLSEPQVFIADFAAPNSLR